MLDPETNRNAVEWKQARPEDAAISTQPIPPHTLPHLPLQVFKNYAAAPV